MLYPGRRACHVTCGPCLYPDNPKCAACEIVGHCRLALDYFKSLRSGVTKKFYFEEQLTGEETLYHALSFVEAQQHLVNTVGKRKYMKFLKETNTERFNLPIETQELPENSNISPEKTREIQERSRQRSLIIVEVENRGPSTISELSKAIGMEKSKLLKHLIAMRQFGKVRIVGERDNQAIYDLLE